MAVAVRCCVGAVSPLADAVAVLAPYSLLLVLHHGMGGSNVSCVQVNEGTSFFDKRYGITCHWRQAALTRSSSLLSSNLGLG